MNRADRSGDGKRAEQRRLRPQILQRRLASSPAAIYRSLERRRKRLEDRLREEKLLLRTAVRRPSRARPSPELRADDLDDAPGDEAEAVEEQIVDQATAAPTSTSLRAEIVTCKDLEERRCA